MLTELLQAALTLVASFAVRWLFALIGVELDEATFNAIVAGLVTLLLGLFTVRATRAAVAGTRFAGLLKKE
jgi:xanthosine utilization system XapX-like protein